MPNSSRTSSSRSASSKRIGAIGYSACQLRPEPVELLALGRDDGLRRLGDEALVGELALGALDLGLQRLARGLDLGGGLGRVDARQQLDRQPRDRDDGDRLAVVVARRAQAREARDERASRRRGRRGARPGTRPA